MLHRPASRRFHTWVWLQAVVLAVATACFGIESAAAGQAVRAVILFCFIPLILLIAAGAHDRTRNR